MEERTYYLLKKYFEVNLEGIKWAEIRDNIILEHEYLNLPESIREPTPHRYLVLNKYIERVVDIPAETYCITQKGIDAYIFENEERSKKKLEQEKEAQFKEQLKKVNQSVIDTNANLVITNKFQKVYGLWSLIISGLTMLFILTTVYQQCQDTSSQELRGIKIQLQKVDSTLKLQQQSYPQKDSTRIKKIAISRTKPSVES